MLRDTQTLAVLPPDELRFYWSPRARFIYCGYTAFTTVIVVGFALGSSKLWSPVGLGVAIVGGFAVMATSMLYTAAVSGVRETPTGIQWRTGSRWRRAYRGEAAWADARSFAYTKLSSGIERPVVVLEGRSRKIIWGAAREMRWRGGRTTDFAALLVERAATFGVQLEPVVDDTASKSRAKSTGPEPNQRP